MSRGFYWRVVLVLAALLAAWTILWPSIPRIAPPWVQRLIKPRINLGLDIRGGARLSYDVQIGAAIAQRRDRAIEGIRDQLARDFSFHHGDGRITEEESQRLLTRVQVRRNDQDNRELTIHFVNAGDASRVDRHFLQQFALVERSRSGGNVVLAVQQDVVDEIERSSVQEAVRRIENRIDELSVKETSITSRGETIVIEVPGPADQNEAAAANARALALQQQAGTAPAAATPEGQQQHLGIPPYLQQIQDVIRRTAHLEFRMCADSATVLDRFQEGGELASRVPQGITLVAEHGVSAGTRADDSIVYASPLHFQATGPEGLRNLREFIRSIRSEIPDTYDLLIGEDETEARRTRQEVPNERKVWRTYTVEHIANVTGDMIQSADVQIKQDTNQPYVALSFKTDGARAFAQVTTDNVHKRFAIVLDDRVMSAPVINEPIRNGSASITLGSGDFRSQMREAQDLVVVLRAGALPAPLSEGSVDFIGPTLGKDTIRSALIAAAVGIGLVMLFMAFWYGSAGMIANTAVLLNLLIQLATIALLGATLTLPGFAGLALTVGMAVDSNVLINERIREELRAGKSLRAAVDAGYEHAFRAILDGHVTTFISGVVLLQYGTGPIKGFAVMLLIGIVANLFSGVFATRVVFDWLVRGLRIKKLSLG